MKQMLIAGNAAYPSSAKTYTDLKAGQVGVFDDTGTILTGKPEDKVKSFAIALGYGEDKQLQVIDQITRRTLSVVKGEYQEATIFTCKLTIPTVTAGKDYTIIAVKKGKQFHERYRWTATVRATEKDTTATIATKLSKQFMANQTNLELKVTNVAAVITFEAVKPATDYAVVGADELMGVEPTEVTNGIQGYGDVAHVKKLAQEASSEYGFEYLGGGDDLDIYPGYPKPVASTEYAIYTLTFMNPRTVKTVDELVRQIVQIAVPMDSAAISTLDAIFEIEDETYKPLSDTTDSMC